MKGKSVRLKDETHRKLKILAAETGRCINGDLLEDVVLLGIEEARKNFARTVSCTGDSSAQGVTA